MSERLKNKNAIVTAAGQGIGKATAIAFHNEGANVIATDLNEETLKNLNKEYPKIKVQKLDSTNKAEIESFTKTLGKVDILLNAVGFVHHGTILECEEKDWDFSFNVNIKSMYFMVKSILPKMIEQNGGSIINISSIASSIRGLPNRFVYGASKAAIIGFTKSASRELGRYNINVNVICPGITKTEMTGKLQSDEKLRKIYEARIQLGRFAAPEEIAPAFVFLASDDASYITGQVLGVDGGYIG